MTLKRLPQMQPFFLSKPKYRLIALFFPLPDNILALAMAGCETPIGSPLQVYPYTIPSTAQGDCISRFSQSLLSSFHPLSLFFNRSFRESLAIDLPGFRLE
jgi:hypothetical protein